jgi:hypothetical protein
MMLAIPIFFSVLALSSSASIYGQTAGVNENAILDNATSALNNATNTLAEAASNISKTPISGKLDKATKTLENIASNINKTAKPISPINTTKVVNAIYTQGLPVIFLIVIAAAMIIPLVIDLVFTHLKKSKQNISKYYHAQSGMSQLYRTLMTFGIILLVSTVVFYVLALLTVAIYTPSTPAPIIQSLVDVLKSLSTILGTALATIVAFYFGTRSAESAAEKASARAASSKPDNSETSKPDNSETSKQ